MYLDDVITTGPQVCVHLSLEPAYVDISRCQAASGHLEHPVGTVAEHHVVRLPVLTVDLVVEAALSAVSGRVGGHVRLASTARAGAGVIDE